MTIPSGTPDATLVTYRPEFREAFERLNRDGERLHDAQPLRLERENRYFWTRSMVEIQLSSHVLPPSSEYDCTNRADVGVMSDQT
jgi:hypothetical protein